MDWTKTRVIFVPGAGGNKEMIEFVEGFHWQKQ
jgi:hypothetical protein